MGSFEFMKENEWVADSHTYVGAGGGLISVLFFNLTEINHICNRRNSVLDRSLIKNGVHKITNTS